MKCWLPVFFSSPEHQVLRVSCCDCAVSVMRRPSFSINSSLCVRARGHIFSEILMKLGQNVCLNAMSDRFENGSCLGQKLGH